MPATTHATVTVHSSETRTYRFDGALTDAEIVTEIATGHHDPTSTRVHQEDLDVVAVDHKP